MQRLYKSEKVAFRLLFLGGVAEHVFYVGLSLGAAKDAFELVVNAWVYDQRA